MKFDFFLLDCREKKLYDEKHFAQSFHLDPGLLAGTDIEELEAILKTLKEMDGEKHFVFLSTKNDMFIVARFVLLFLQKGFHFLSACLEGYGNCEGLLLRNGRSDGGLIISETCTKNDLHLFDEDVANKLFGTQATSMFKNAFTYVSKNVSRSSLTETLTSNLKNAVSIMGQGNEQGEEERNSERSGNATGKHNNLECV